MSLIGISVSLMKLGMESETVEFKKSTGELKQACVSLAAMLNKTGEAVVYFGVNPDGEVVGQEVSEATLRRVSRGIFEAIEPQVYPTVEVVDMAGKTVICAQVTGGDGPYSAHGKYYLRTADEDRMVTPPQLRTLFAEAAYRGSWEKGQSEATIDNVDESSVRAFYRRAVDSGRLPQLEPFTVRGLLEQLSLTAGERLTVAGEYLFGATGPVTVKMAVFATPEKLTFLDMKTLEGNITELIGATEKYILENIRWAVEFTGGPRQEIPEIPKKAIHEVVANSFAHARYSGLATSHEVCIYPDRVTIYNPGAFATDRTVDDYVRGSIPSSLRNETIAKTLYLSNQIEQFGSGLKRVDMLCREASVTYSYHNEESGPAAGFTFIFYRNRPDISPVRPAGNAAVETITIPTEVRKPQPLSPEPLSPEPLSEVEQALLKLLQENPQQSRQTLAEAVGRTVRTVQRALNRLVEKGYIQRVGAKRMSTWVLL